jgi:hypothetical protein
MSATSADNRVPKVVKERFTPMLSVLEQGHFGTHGSAIPG